MLSSCPKVRIIIKGEGDYNLVGTAHLTSQGITGYSFNLDLNNLDIVSDYYTGHLVGNLQLIEEEFHGRRLPKLKGFQVYSKLNYAQINVGRLDDLGLKEVSLDALKEVLTIHPTCVGLRVLGNGEIKSAVTVKASYVTPSAKEKIEAAGGKVELV